MTMQNDLPNREIIDATQNAVLSVADSVSDVFENAQAFGHGEAFYLSPEFWVGFSFVLVVIGLARPVGRFLYQMLKKRGENIADRINESSQLKEDAQKLLAEYEGKYRKVEQEAQEILARAEREINLLKKEKIAQLEQDMVRKEREALERISASQENASKEISDLAICKAMDAVKKVLKEKLTDKEKDQLIDDSIELIVKAYK